MTDNSTSPLDKEESIAKREAEEAAKLNDRMAEMMAPIDNPEEDIMPTPYHPHGIQSPYPYNPVPAYPRTYPSPIGAQRKENEELLLSLEAIEDVETGDFELIVKAGIKIGKSDVMMLKRGELTDLVLKRLLKIKERLGRELARKITLTNLLK